jgi:hypothetical protein
MMKTNRKGKSIIRTTVVILFLLITCDSVLATSILSEGILFESAAVSFLTSDIEDPNTAGFDSEGDITYAGDFEANLFVRIVNLDMGTTVYTLIQHYPLINPSPGVIFFEKRFGGLSENTNYEASLGLYGRFNELPSFDILGWRIFRVAPNSLATNYVPNLSIVEPVAVFGNGVSNPVPEPATILMLGFSLFGLAALRKKFK